MKAQLALRMKYRLTAVRKRHYVPHGTGARARAKFQFVESVLKLWDTRGREYRYCKISLTWGGVTATLSVLSFW